MRCENTEELLDFDRMYIEKFGVIAGLDEAGRGPLAGPVVAAAVILGEKIEGLFDSKALTEKVREELFDKIIKKAKVGIGLSSPDEIDTFNIFEATKLAMNRAIKKLPIQPDYVIIDGKHLKLNNRGECIVSGDQKSASIAAASIVAKVFRDRLMKALAVLYPEYSWDKNKGYGTAEHLKALKIYGPTLWHRLTFSPVKALLNREIVLSWLQNDVISERRLFRVGMLF
ncbi:MULTISPECIES: ribonuclease HII [Kosmotoga]|uniref:Ribonuclease HII n=1 Tax=Kosmotoga olearia (strain ATCC BAA-1733 / DSM 21960 / TBF 19.5.1) TaxID=521045 RepID=C5CGC6_KOSOT|nr:MULTISPECIES: ribonuclease HII [Kosmotoga]ACR79567.1 Ribonuclease H [Kosmotoga olearia TBF 19.5.1]MDI3523919.1 ribonuclease [Kosmotoga sp.]MDK2953302.1 ribonuclease [Kosmotoga sp.]OAA22117.1 ribonuclease HII [Kosmotoga sp. DU53]